MKNIIISLSIVLGAAQTVYGQQELQFSQTINNPYFFNPAAGGLSNVGEVFLSDRTQWSGIEGRPQSFYASISSIIDTKQDDENFALQEFNTERKSFFESPQRTLGRKHVLGGKLFSDQIGPFKKTAVQASYAYHLPVSPRWNVGVGLSFGLSNFGIDETKATLSTGGDPAYLSYAANSPRQNYFDANAGLVLYSSSFLLSLSTSQFLNTQAKFDGVTSDSYYVRHYFALASKRFDVGTDYCIEPLVMTKFLSNAPLTFDAGARFHYQNIGFMSIIYRNQSALSVGIGCNLLKNFRMCYSYDLSIGKTRSFGTGAHEIQLGILFGHKRNLSKEFRKSEQERKIREQHELEDNQ